MSSMKKWSVIIMVSLFVLGISLDGFSQKKDVGGEFAAGVRFGGTTALTLKKYSGYNKSAW